MPFVAEPAEVLVPVRPEEILRPTRVAWRHSSGLLATRVFPTEARAYAFAAGRDRVVSVEDARLAPPAQEARRRFFRRSR